MKDRILVIDDDAIIRRLLGRLLAGRGFEVVVAADGEEGLAALEEADLEPRLLRLALPTEEDPVSSLNIAASRRG